MLSARVAACSVQSRRYGVNEPAPQVSPGGSAARNCCPAGSRAALTLGRAPEPHRLPYPVKQRVGLEVRLRRPLSEGLSRSCRIGTASSATGSRDDMRHSSPACGHTAQPAFGLSGCGDQIDRHARACARLQTLRPLPACQTRARCRRARRWTGAAWSTQHAMRPCAQLQHAASPVTWAVGKCCTEVGWDGAPQRRHRLQQRRWHPFVVLPHA